MPRRTLLSAADRVALFSPPDNQDDLIRYYSLTDRDLALIRRRRRHDQRYGFAVMLCYMRYPGIVLGVGDCPLPALLKYLSDQLSLPTSLWQEYGRRVQTRREHIGELQRAFGLQPYSPGRDASDAMECIQPVAEQTDKGLVLGQALAEHFRGRRILMPSADVFEAICAEAATRAMRRIYSVLTERLTAIDRHSLDALLSRRGETKTTTLTWVRQPPGAPSPTNLLEHIDRMKALEAIELPVNIAHGVHQNRLLKIAREGGQMTPQHLADLEDTRRHATLVALVVEGRATLIDEIVDLHDRFIGKIINRAKRNHAEDFENAAKAMNEKLHLFGRVGQALVEARSNGLDPFRAIEHIMPWAAFEQSVREAQQLAERDDFDFLHRVADSYSQVRRYSAEFLNALRFRPTPAARDLFDGVTALREMHASRVRVMPENTPTAFVTKRWGKLVFTDDGVDRRYFEICTMAELKNSLRSGDIWVEGSRQFKAFEDYLIPQDRYQALRSGQKLPLATLPDCEAYLATRVDLLRNRLSTVDALAREDGLPDVVLNAAGLRITPLANAVPEEVEPLAARIYGLLPRVKITDVLVEVDAWTGFTKHFTHLKSGQPAEDKTLLLTAILADGINLGLAKMAESCPGTTRARLEHLHAWHIRDNTYSAALATLVNAQHRHRFAAYWGNGKTSSSDGQRFRSGGRAHVVGNVNPKYGSDPGILFYSHISDQYAPFHTKVINVGPRDATYVLDGLLNHESELRIEEHYTDTAGFTDHVFGLMHLFGFRFVPRLRDLGDRKLYIPDKNTPYPGLTYLLGEPIDFDRIRAQWDDLLRLAASVKEGVVTASLILRKLGSYPRQNGLALALREIGRIERTLFILDWLQNPALRRRAHVVLNKGEAKHALERAVFFNRLGEVRDRSFDDQRFRASGLNLTVAAITLWNTVYLERAVEDLRSRRVPVDGELLRHLSPLGWEHINLTGDYIWKQSKVVEKGEFRRLRHEPEPLAV